MASAPADSARLNALFDMDWSDDTLLCLHDPAKEDAASAPSVAQADAPTSADSLVGAAQPAWDDRESGRSGSAPHQADDGDDLPTRQAAAGAEPVLHDVPVPHPMSAPASAARPGRGELALRQAFGRRPSWRRTGWRGAAVAAIAGGGSMAAGIAIALLPDGTAPMRQPATEARQASPEHVAVAEARTLSVAMVHTAAADAASVGTAPRGGSSAPSGTAVAEEPPDTDDWARYSPVTLAYEDPHDDAPAASAIRTISSLRTEAAGPSARPAGAVAGNSLPSLPQRSAADRQPNGSGKPRGLGTPAEAADSIPSIAYLHGDAASPLNLRPGDDVTAFAAPHPIPPAPQAVAEANAAHAGSGAMPWPDAAAPAAAASGVQAAPVHRTSKAQAPDSVTSEAEPAFTSVASGSQAGVPPDAVPQIIATRSPPPPGSDPEALFRDAVDIALEDPRAAVVGYARAALLGHSRAAYYLGQIYETGDGVPVDYAIARHWYEAASEGNRRAENRLSDLPRPQDGGMEAPLPLLAQPLDAGEADFVWTSGEGADPTSYVVEISLNPGVGADAAYAVSGSAARLPLVEGATHWRVLALQATDKRSTASDWRALSPVGSDRSAAAEMRPDHL